LQFKDTFDDLETWVLKTSHDTLLSAQDPVDRAEHVRRCDRYVEQLRVFGRRFRLPAELYVGTRYYQPPGTDKRRGWERKYVEHRARTPLADSSNNREATVDKLSSRSSDGRRSRTRKLTRLPGTTTYIISITIRFFL
jgi:hypothetical protein